MKHVPKDISKKFADDALQINPAFKASLRQQLFTKEQPMAKATSFTDKFTTFFKQNNFVPLTAVFLALILVGGGSALITNNRAEQARQAEISLPQTTDVLPVSDIQAKALIDEPNLTVASIELENEDEGLLYKVKFSDGSIRFYNAKTGEAVVRSNNIETDTSVPSGFVAGITVDQARQIAQTQRPGKTVTKIELETENGVVVYSVRFSDNGRVDVNASNGSVVRVRSGSDSETNSSSDSSDDSDDGSDDNSGSSSNSGSGTDDSDSGHDSGDDHSGSGHGSDDN